MKDYDETYDILCDLKCEPKYEYLKVQALKDVKELIEENKKLIEENKRLTENFNEAVDQTNECRKELCKKCGAYRDNGLIVCEHCKWY